MKFKNLLYLIENNILTITINRPEKLNALNQDTLEELHQALTKAKNDKKTKIIIITGSGTKAFVAGADIKEFAGFNAIEGQTLSETGHTKVFDFIETLNKPVIAAINGYALGGGLELAMACHLRVASKNAYFGLPETSLGLIPGYGGTQRLPQLIGKGRATELILSAKMITADTALQYGLVNYVEELANLLPKAETLANEIIKNAPSAINAAIKCINAHFDKNLNGFEVEKERFGNCFETADFEEGTSAFLEKRKPKF